MWDLTVDRPQVSAAPNWASDRTGGDHPIQVEQEPSHPGLRAGPQAITGESHGPGGVVLGPKPLSPLFGPLSGGRQLPDQYQHRAQVRVGP